MKKRYFVALPGGASHVSTIAGAAMALDEHVDVVGWSGVSAGFLVSLLAAFGELHRAPALVTEMLQHNRVLDVKVDGKLGLCAWEVVPALVDKVLGANARMGDALVPLVGVVTDADTGRPLYVSKREHPNVLVRDVARATSAIHPLAPFVPIPSLGTELSPDIRLFIDGGFTDNLPDAVFDNHAQPTISVSLRDTAGVIRVPTEATDPLAPLKQALAVVRAVTFAQAQRKSRRRFIDGVAVDIEAIGSGLNFNLTPEQTAERIASGRAGVFAAVSAGCFDSLD